MSLNCKEASRLISAGLDRDLDLGQRTTLRLHLLICTACSRVKAQFAFLHRAAPDYPGLEDDALPPNA
jgi:Putative zinc-finger